MTGSSATGEQHCLLQVKKSRAGPSQKDHSSSWLMASSSALISFLAFAPLKWKEWRALLEELVLLFLARNRLYSHLGLLYQSSSRSTGKWPRKSTDTYWEAVTSVACLYLYAKHVASTKFIKARQKDQSTDTATKYFSQPVVKERACEQTVPAHVTKTPIFQCRRAVLVGRSLSVTRLRRELNEHHLIKGREEPALRSWNLVRVAPTQRLDPSLPPSVLQIDCSLSALDLIVIITNPMCPARP